MKLMKKGRRGKKLTMPNNFLARCIVCLMTGLPRQPIAPGKFVLCFWEVQGVDGFCSYMNFIYAYTAFLHHCISKITIGHGMHCLFPFLEIIYSKGWSGIKHTVEGLGEF